MKKLFFLFVTLFCFGKVMSQTDRYIYQTEVNPDTINLVNMKVETTYLDIKGNQSLFISESKLLQDSLRTVLRQQENTEVKKSKKDKSAFPKMPNGKSIQPTFFDYFIIKNLEDRSVQMVENIGSKQVYYQEDRKMDWDISPQTAEFNHYKVQKATMTFGGRNWTAWFAPEIKIPDGPYKFLGLPGLILKLEDDKGDYRFSFVKKITIPNSFSESIKPDARKSTRINFRGDKASVRMEMVKNKDSEINFDSFNRMNQRNGTMNGGFGAQPGMNGGMPNDIIGGQPNLQPGNPLEQSVGKNANLMNIGNSNPIELSNK
ncbi:GLPGLI family protein [Chryseobacterium sp. SC28]|uniref:GLPGLI family protein n=1 Tax=Chryseobacterium sp. SC28 TaxID=2268028 RepID=UPI000F648E82|nr:GLPGLI family protein [Chryseobacterium sp. SC28]RRQ47136.1 GLPGLI family protein [Chryseobacterium sp. SC28]